MKNAPKAIYILLIINLFSWNIIGQLKNSTIYAPPLDIPLAVSSNFGELRSDAFHFGIDFKTAGTTGLNVHSIDTGYVSRIKIEAGGYGRALYITHPNGIVSVYAHLSSLNKLISEYCKNEQYKQMQYAVDLAIGPGKLPVRKGEIVALSGNAGYSFGAHLHFEIRDAKTEETLNVLHLFNFKVVDTLPPIFNQLWIYPIDSISKVNNNSTAISFPTAKKGGNYELIIVKPIVVSGKIAFGIQAHDILNNNANKTGIYSIEVFVNDEVYFQQEIDKLSFNDMRYVNSVLDYGRLLRDSEKINRLFLQPNNLLNIYKTVKNRGVLAIEDTLSRNIRIVIKDANMNQSVLRFIIKGAGSYVKSGVSKINVESLLQKLNCKQPNTITKGDFILNIPLNALYDDLKFEFYKSPRQPGFYSEMYSVHNIYTPMQKACIINIKPVGVKSKYLSKAVIVNIGKSGKISSLGGVLKDGFIQANIKSFGKYSIMIDTIPPIIKPLFKNAKKNDFTNSSEMQFMIEDVLSGVKIYRGEIDGKWSLFEYNAKDHLLYYKFDSAHIGTGKDHTLELVVTDERGNKSDYHTTFYK